MNRNSTLLVSAVLLMLLAIYLVYLGTTKKMMPPTITGAGFIVIALAFLSLRTR